MNVAARARAAALQIEMKKDGLSQRQDGRWQLKVIIHPNDMPAALSLAPMGTRYMAALVEIGDDEQPVERQASPASKRQFADLAPAQQAGILCASGRFRKFLHETREMAWLLALSTSQDDPEKAAATAVRALCGVHSRADLAKNPQAEIAWQDLQREYNAWLTA